MMSCNERFNDFYMWYIFSSRYDVNGLEDMIARQTRGHDIDWLPELEKKTPSPEE